MSWKERGFLGLSMEMQGLWKKMGKASPWKIKIMNWRQQTLLFITIGMAEYSLSWLNHKINLSVLGRKKNLATWLDLMANTLGEVIPFIIYVSTQNWIFLIPRILGNTWGTRTMAGRKIKPRKTTYRKKISVTTA